MLSPTRFYIYLRSIFWRWLISYWYARDRRAPPLPHPAAPTFTLSIPSTLSPTRGTIPLLFYTPPSYKRPSRHHPPQALLPVVINFHGGGHTIGSAHDDIRWAAAITTHNAVCISVDYRLAALHPFPTALEDCASAIAWVSEHAAAHGLDASRIVVGGFSAGAALAFTSLYLLADKANEGGGGGGGGGVVVAARAAPVVGIVAFYPRLDYTLSGERRRAVSPVAAEKDPIPRFLGVMYEEAYFYPRPRDMAHRYVSAGLAADEVVREVLPRRIFLQSCGWDDLMREAEDFRARLGALGKVVGGGVLEGQVHAWDKAAAFNKQNELRDRVYAEAMGEVREMWETAVVPGSKL